MNAGLARAKAKGTKLGRPPGARSDNFVRWALISRSVQRRCIAFATPSLVFLSLKIRVLFPWKKNGPS